MVSSVDKLLRSRRPFVRAFAAAAVCMALAVSAHAQEVRVEVVKHADGEPIPGTLLTLIPEKDSAPVARFTDRAGRATFIAPRRGGYRVRAERVGYDTWLSVVLVPSRAPTRVRAGMKPRSLRLPPVTGRGVTQCSNLGEQATVAGDMWGEIRKALEANSLTESQGLAPVDIESYDRIIDANGAIVSEKSDRRRANSMRPHHFASLRSDGAGSSAQSLLGIPDAATLLSEQFVNSHCFTGIRGVGPENGLLGLEFKPAKLGNKPDLSGVLWLDPITYSLRHLAFDYVNIPVSVRTARASGRVEYQQLSGGEWIVSRWRLRIPRGSATARPGPGSITGYHEIGGIARSAGSPAMPPAAVVSAPSEGQTRISGTVLDGTTGKPLAGVGVSTVSGAHKTATNRGGGYELLVASLEDSLVFEHPRLRLFRVPPVVPVTVTSGGVAQASVIVPGYAALRKALCPATSSKQPAGLAVGYVRDESGNPVADAQVAATWQVLWTEEKGRLVSTKQSRRVDVRTAADGSYVICGFTRDAPVALAVITDGRLRVENRVAVPTSMVLEHDFRIAR
jgi:hypothetical protein